MLITEDRMEISVLARHGSQRRRRLLSPPRRRGRPHHDRYGSCYKSRAGAEAAGCSGSSTSAQGPIRRKPTARPTASSRTALREWAATCRACRRAIREAALKPGQQKRVQDLRRGASTPALSTCKIHGATCCHTSQADPPSFPLGGCAADWAPGCSAASPAFAARRRNHCSSQLQHRRGACSPSAGSDEPVLRLKSVPVLQSRRPKCRIPRRKRDPGSLGPLFREGTALILAAIEVAFDFWHDVRSSICS